MKLNSRNWIWLTVLAGCIAATSGLKAAERAAHDELYSIVRNGKLSELKDLLGKGTSIDERDQSGDTLLMRAVLYGNVEQVKYLLTRGADVNATNQFGVTALMRAGGDKTTARLLLDNGADVNARSAFGNTALILSARNFDGFEAVSMLLKKDADLKATNIFGVTPMLTAAASGNSKTVKLLLENGADPNSHPAPSQDGTLWGGGRTR